MLRPGLIVAKSASCTAQARFGNTCPTGQAGRTPQLNVPSARRRGRQRSSRNAGLVETPPSTSTTTQRTTFPRICIGFPPGTQYTSTPAHCRIAAANGPSSRPPSEDTENDRYQRRRLLERSHRGKIGKQTDRRHSPSVAQTAKNLGCEPLGRGRIAAAPCPCQLEECLFRLGRHFARDHDSRRGARVCPNGFQCARPNAHALLRRRHRGTELGEGVHALQAIVDRGSAAEEVIESCVDSR